MFIEIGPHPTLIGMAQAVVPPDSGLWLPSLRHGRDDWEQLLDSLARLYTHGASIDWEGFDRPYPRRKLALPTYPFQRERYWIAAPPGRPRRSAGEHPLLGRRLRSALTQVQFEQELRTDSIDYLHDHRVFGAAILPATGYVETALAAGAELGPVAGLEGVEVLSALVVEDGATRAVQTILTPEGDGAGFEILSQGDDEAHWQLHAARADPHHGHGRSRGGRPRRHAGRSHGDDQRRASTTRGCRRGASPSAPACAASSRSGGATVRCSAGSACGPSRPATGCTRPSWTAASRPWPGWHRTGRRPTCRSPSATSTLYGTPGATAWAHATRPAAQSGPETLMADVRVYDDAGQLVAAVRDLCFKRAGREALLGLGRAKVADWLYQLAWRPQPSEGQELAGAIELPAPAELVFAAVTHQATLEAEHGIGRHQGLLDALEELSGDYVALALAQLGVSLTPGPRFTAEQLGVVAQHRRLLDRLLAGLAGDGLLRRDGDGWVVARPAAPGDVAARWAQLAEEHPDGRGELTIVRRCGEGLAAALRGEVDPLRAALPGRLDRGGRADVPAVAVRPLLQLPGRRGRRRGRGQPPRPPPRPGPGDRRRYGRHHRLRPAPPAGRAASSTPSPTSRRCSWREQREQFGAYPFVDFRTLDIEADPESQGFAPHQLRPRRRGQRAARHGRPSPHVRPRGAAPGPRRPARAAGDDEAAALHRHLLRADAGMVEADGRRTSAADYLLLDRAGWLRFLTDAGFEAPRPRPPSSPPAPTCRSRRWSWPAPRPAPLRRTGLPAGRRSWLILADAGGVGATLADLLDGARRHGHPRDRRTHLPPDRCRALRDRSRPPGGRGSPRAGGVGRRLGRAVHLWSLDEPAPALMATQARRTAAARSRSPRPSSSAVHRPGCGSSPRAPDRCSVGRPTRPRRPCGAWAG